MTYECNAGHIAIIYGSQPCPLCACHESLAAVKRVRDRVATRDKIGSWCIGDEAKSPYVHRADVLAQLDEALAVNDETYVPDPKPLKTEPLKRNVYDGTKPKENQ